MVDALIIRTGRPRSGILREQSLERNLAKGTSIKVRRCVNEAATARIYVGRDVEFRKMVLPSLQFSIHAGGSGEIRTHGRVSPSPVFKTGAFNRSATLPIEVNHGNSDGWGS